MAATPPQQPRRTGQTRVSRALGSTSREQTPWHLLAVLLLATVLIPFHARRSGAEEDDATKAGKAKDAAPKDAAPKDEGPAADEPKSEGAEEAPKAKVLPRTKTTLEIEGAATFKPLGPLGQIQFRYSAVADNRGEDANQILRGDLLLAHPGGWLVPLDPDTIDGSFFRGALDVAGGKQLDIAGQDYQSLTPASHALLSIYARDGHAEILTPIVRKNYEPPGPMEQPWPFGVGVVGPLEVVKYSDGRTSLMLIGQHQVLHGGTPTKVQTTVSLGSDRGSTEPLRWKGLDAKGDRRALWPFVRRLDVDDGFKAGLLGLTSKATLDGREERFTKTWPVVRVQPEPVQGPVLGTWQLSNGPGQTPMHAHYANPQFRYAYDLVVLEKGSTHRSDPHKNESYFAWNRSVRAAADGVIVAFCHAERDNPGYRGAATNCYTNHIVIRHANGLHTAYLHLRQRSISKGIQLDTKVTAGQVIARVGNSGESSEPHLHFMAFRVDTTGRWRSVPVSFTNAFHDAKATRPVEAVPVGGRIVHFRSKH
jgi:hypothetical protein